MSNILRKNTSDIDLKLSTYQYTDFVLYHKNIFPVKSVIETDNLIVNFTFNSLIVCSDYEYENAISNAGTICNIGLTGIDNRYVNSITGETINLDGNLNFCVKAVSGDVYNYTITNDNSNYATLNGGFYQGFYRLAGYDYNVLPERFNHGWTFETWINPKNLNNDENILNDIGINNSNFIWYWGVRAENKFGDFNFNEIGIDTCDSKINLSPTSEITDTTLNGINPFLFYTKTKVCEGIKKTEIITQYKYCDDLIDNVIGLRYTENGNINFRYITYSGECVENNIEKQIIIIDYYSDEAIIFNDNWYHISVIFEPYNILTECDDDKTEGDIKIYVNGLLKLKIENFKEFIPYQLNEHKDKQLGVPFNMSFGGGSQGLLETKTFTNTYTGNFPFTVVDYEFEFNECDIFKGLNVDGNYFKSPKLLSFNEYDDICEFISNSIANRFGNIEFEIIEDISPKKIKVKLKAVFSKINYIEFLNKNILPTKIRTYEISNTNNCNLIENYFAGTFVGFLGKTKFYNNSLPIQQLRKNIEIEQNIYN